MKDKIKERILKDVQYELDEIDVDGLIEKLLKEERVTEIARIMVRKLVAEKVTTSIQAKLSKSTFLIDAWTADKVTAFLLELGIK